jgi:hypothetical protein
VSRVLTRTLVCDQCGAEFGQNTGFLPLTVLRRQARAAGWRRGAGREDLCPDHPKGGAQ